MAKIRKKMEPKATPTPMPFLAPILFASFSFASYLKIPTIDKNEYGDRAKPPHFTANYLTAACFSPPKA